MPDRIRRTALLRALVALALGAIILTPALVVAAAADAAAPVAIDSPATGTVTSAATLDVIITTDESADYVGAELRLAGGSFASGCQVLIEILTTRTCTVSFNDFGVFEFRAYSLVENDPGPNDDEYAYTEWRTVTRADDQAVTFSAPTGLPLSSLTTVVSGNGPRMGSVTVTGSSPTSESVPVCSDVPVTAAGFWTCSPTLAEYGSWSLTAEAFPIIDGSFTSATVAFDVIPPAPTVSVQADGRVAATVTALTAAPNVGQLGVSIGLSGEFPSVFCPDEWFYGVTEGTSQFCSLDVTASGGVYFIESTQVVNELSSGSRTDLVWIPAQPTITSQTTVEPGTLRISGGKDGALDYSGVTATGTTIDLYDGEQLICDDVGTPDSLTWTCEAALNPGVHALTAVATAVGLNGNDEGISSATNGSSIASVGFTTSSVPPAATVQHTLTPGSISTRLTTPPGGEGSIELFLAELSEGDDAGYYGYYYTATGGCPTPSDGRVYGDQVIECDFGELAPGIWEVWTYQRVDDPLTIAPDRVEYEVADDYILIPVAPTLTATVDAQNRVTLAGTADAGASVTVVDDSGSTRCSTTATESGQWSCGPLNTSRTTEWRATQRAASFNAAPCSECGYDHIRSFRGASPYSTTVATVAVAPASAPTLPTPTPTPPTWVLGLPGTDFTVGQSVTLTGEGLIPGSRIDVEIRSTPRALGSTTAGSAGTFSLTVTIPADMDPGQHQIVVIVTPPGQAAQSQSQSVTILGAEPARESASAPPKSEDAPTSAGSLDDGGGGSSGAGATVLTDTVPTVADIVRQPLIVLAAGGVALAILLLVALPTELLNSTLSSNSRRLGRGFAAVEGAISRATAWFIATTRTPAIAAAVVVFVTAVIFGFVDPDFGLNLTSVRLVLSLGLGLFVVSYVASWISGAIITRAWNVESSIQLQPAALVFAVLGVIVARLLDFSPGFLIGLVIGLEIASSTREPFRSRAVVVKFGVIAGLALVAWGGYSLLAATLTPDAGFATLLTLDTLAAIVVEGLTAAAVGILPLGYLEGRDLFRSSKRWWVAAFVGLVTLFALLVLPIASGEAGDRDWVTWIIVLVAFATITIALWAFFEFTGRRMRADDDENAVVFENAESN